jgi:hypothetical protein
MAPGRRRVQLLLGLALAPALLAGCGDDEPPPSVAEVRSAQRQFAYPLHWAGPSVDGLPLTSLITTHASPSVGYGTCKPAGDSGCTLPVTIQTDSICARNALVHGRRPSGSRRVRGVIARRDAEGTIEIPTGVSNVTVFARPEHIEGVLAALRPVRGARTLRLPQPRYPLEYVAELRRVRDAYVRAGSVRAVRDRLGISQRAVRFRLRLAKELGPARLRRPASDFAGEPCAVEPPR